MPRRPSHRAARPRLDTVEPRLLLSGDPTAVWIGQDGHDLAGPSSTLGPSDVQDIHIALSNLPANEVVNGISAYPNGGGDWEVNGTNGSWAGAFVNSPGVSTGDLYVEPYQVETGRSVYLVLHYADGTQFGFGFAGGTADPNLRMPAAALQVAWAGQDGSDFVGRGPAVGPDGLKDVHVDLSNLSANVDITSAAVTSSTGEVWRSGTDHQGDSNAELVRRAGDPTKADLYIQPDVDLAGSTLTVVLNYANGKTDNAGVAGAAVDPTAKAPTPGPLPTVSTGPTARWLGQDGTDDPGAVHLAVDGLSPGRKVVGASLSDPAGGSWSYQRAGLTTYVDPSAAPLSYHPSTDPAHADLTFAPDRDEAGSSLSLLLRYDDSSFATIAVAGGSDDVGKLAPGIAATSIVAHPGDDLNDLANRYGTVHLSAGSYPMAAPLVLNGPVAITADIGATLLFSQSADAPTWAAAVKINASHTTLDGFAVRFAGPVRWTPNVSYGPAVVGTSDNFDGVQADPKIAVVARNLDLQSPPVPVGTVEAPRLLRLITARSGEVSGNTLKGGITEFAGGPWRITGNTYLGTVPNTVAFAAVAGHGTHDIVISNNHVEPVGPSGKTYRFLVLTGSGYDDRIQSNTVVGIGPLDSDAGPNVNAPETILTESYSLDFEGAPAAISADRTVLQIPSHLGSTPRVGDVVAIVGGASAGHYVRIVQIIDSSTYLLASPLPSGVDAVSIAGGFVGETFTGNTIDDRGSSSSVDLFLAGNHFGTTVANNHFLGGGTAFRITAAPSEHPVGFGWSHAPVLGLTLEGNTLDDVLLGGSIAVEHADAIKADKGRTYFSGTIADTTIRWSSAFLAAHPRPVALTLGDPGSIDPAELVVSTANNRVQGPAGSAFTNTLVIHAGDVDGQLVLEQSRSLPNVAPAAPTGLSLVADTGVSATDSLTRDPRLKFDAASGLAGWEYRVGDGSTYLPVTSPGAFTPLGLSQGPNTVHVRAFDPTGQRGPEAAVTFTLDTVAPASPSPVLLASSDSGVSHVDHLTNVRSPVFSATADPTDQLSLVRNGLVIATRIGPGNLIDTAAHADGLYSYILRRTDAAGNTSTSLPTVLLQDTTPPVQVQGLAQAADGGVHFGSTGKTDVYQYRLDGTNSYTSIGSATTFTPAIKGAGYVALYVRAIDLAGNIGPDAVIAATRPSSFAGTWLGQDGGDFAGSATGGPDGIQDIHIALTGLDTTHAITDIEVRPYGGGLWTYPGATRISGAALVRKPGSSTAELYLPPYQADSGRPYWVTVAYSNGVTDGYAVIGGPVDPTKRVAAPPPAGGAPSSRTSGQAAVQTFKSQVQPPAGKAHAVAPKRHHAAVHGAGWGMVARALKPARRR